MTKTKISEIEDPINPSKVFFGLVIGNSLFLPNKRPKKYPPISTDHIPKKIVNKNIVFSLSKKKIATKKLGR